MFSTKIVIRAKIPSIIGIAMGISREKESYEKAKEFGLFFLF